MRLALSSAAAPDADLVALLAACRKRGLAALELRAGDAHGITPAAAPELLRAAAADAAAAGVALSAYLAQPDEQADALAALSAALDAHVLTAVGQAGVAEAVAIATRVLAAGGRAAVQVSGAQAVAEAAAVPADIALAWKAEPVTAAAPAAGLAQVGQQLLQYGERLVHVTLAGGGPEVALQEGQGVGELMSRLALSGWGGTLAVVPSSPRYRVAWRTWLGRLGGTGCGSKVPQRQQLDVRSVAPKDRFECIMGAYERLKLRQALELTVDHDPKCMYYTLRAERGEDSFSFQYLEDGPETWRVLVHKLA